MVFRVRPPQTLFNLLQPPNIHEKPRVRRRLGIRSYCHNRRTSSYAQVVPWESSYTNNLLTASQLHDPTLTYGPNFNKYVFMPTVYENFLRRCSLSSNKSCLPASNISEFRTSTEKSESSSFQPATFSTLPTSTPIVIDSGATFGTTPHVEDIIPGTLQNVDLSVKNLSGTSDITAKGFGRWCVQDIHNNTAIIEPFLHVVPNSDVRLFSPQDYFRGLGGGSYFMDKDSSKLTLSDGKKLEIPYHHANSLPMLFEPRPGSKKSSSLHLLTFDDLCSSQLHLNVADERNQNISAAAKEYVLKHRMCSHANQQWCQELMRERHFKDDNGKVQILPPILKTKHPGTKSVNKCACAGCLLGGATRKPTKSSTVSHNSEMILKEQKLFPWRFSLC